MKVLSSLIKKMTPLILFTIVITSCENVNQKQSERITNEDIQQMKENHLIPLKDAVKMYDKYSKERVKILKDTLKKKYGDEFNDTRNIWIDLNTMKAYLKYLEENASDTEGLAFYFSVNLDNEGKKSNHQTFFIAPTVKNVIKGDTIQSGYTIEKGKRVFLYEAFKEMLDQQQATMQKANFFMLPPPDEDGLLFNDTAGTPPGNNN